MSSLPYLRFKGEVPLSRDDFLCECKKWLDPDEMRTILSADIHSPEGAREDTELLREWKEFDEGLKKELARAREAAKKGKSYKGPDTLKEVMEKETPLLMEEGFEKTRWDFLETRVLGYNFDLNWLVLYFLKLQIVERLATFNKDAGETFFYELCEVQYE